MALNCNECDNDLHINPVDKPNVDWVKIVCSDCGNVENVSMIRLSANTHKRKNED